MSECLSFTNVTAGYGAARVLHGVSLGVARGERIAILGRNGAGKTTLINSFLGLTNVTGGEIRLAGKLGSLRQFSAARAGIAVVPQGRRIIANLTVRENLLLGAAVRRPGPWNMNQVFGLFPILRERANTSGTALSGGQQQMLAIGRALMANPDLMVLDEPSEGLAPVIVDELATILASVAAEGTAILLVEQNYSLVKRVVNRYHVLSKGSIVESGDADQLSRDSLMLHVAV
jgi:branched-chain amino acid transport system ATP-binding protein